MRQWSGRLLPNIFKGYIYLLTHVWPQGPARLLTTRGQLHQCTRVVRAADCRRVTWVVRICGMARQATDRLMAVLDTVLVLVLGHTLLPQLALAMDQGATALACSADCALVGPVTVHSFMVRGTKKA